MKGLRKRFFSRPGVVFVRRGKRIDRVALRERAVAVFREAYRARFGSSNTVAEAP